jgi:PAS domain S-box-containing protein
MESLFIHDEAERLQALHQYGVIDTAPDPALDELARLAAQICNTPVAFISLVDASRVWFKSSFGVDTIEMPRKDSPCEYTILGQEIFEITDATKDERWAPDGFFIGNSNLRFYAGVPLITHDGNALGALAVMDSKVRALTDAQRGALETLARQIILRIELNPRLLDLERSAWERSRIESALTVERNFVSAVLDTVGALVLVYDTAGRVVRVNRMAQNISGFAFEELVGLPYWEKLVPPEEVGEAIAAFNSIREGGFPAAFENHWLSFDGSRLRIAWSVTALRDSQGEVAFIIATGIDVTQQREAESTLRESEASYRQLVEGSLGMVFTHDLNGVLLSVNKHAAESLGYTVEEMTGQSLKNFVPAQSRRYFDDYLRNIRAKGEARGNMYMVHRSGSVHVITYRNNVIDLGDREPYVLSHGIDITEKTHAEERLRTLMHQSNSILESVGDGIYGVDLSGRVTFVNPAAAQMLGYKQSELLGRMMHDLIHHTRADGARCDDGECIIQRSLHSQQPVRVLDEIFWRKDGSSFPVEFIACPQIVEDRAVGAVVAFTDITERRALDRMKDEFISTVSHELRTPLTSLRAALGLVAGGALVSRPEKQNQMLEIAIGNTDRLVSLVNDILDLERIGSGKVQLHYTMCSVEDLLRRAAGLQETSAAKHNIRFVYDVDPVNVWADPDRILQTLTNLISNAIKFSQPGGEIRLAVRQTGEDEARIEVHDSGRGIPADKLDIIFERFQQVDASDSRAMGGTGLGLAICRSIVVQHGGRIWAESQLGHGASFYFTLPTKPSSHLR